MTQSQFDDAITKWEGTKKELQKVIIGQDDFIDKLLLAISIQGHVLIEGLPGLAKTLTIRLLGKILNTNVSRIQFTPDMLPADLTGTMIYNQNEGVFKPHKGPLFANFIIADEINRAPAKVQSALLQAMEEHAVVLGNSVFNLPRPFIVMATQNPIEQEGTFELPEAQLDRFLFKLEIKYPSLEEEIEILKRVDNLNLDIVQQKFSLANIVKIGDLSMEVSVKDSLIRYIAQITTSTRNKSMTMIGIPDSYIDYGASPRASLAILRSSRVMAILNGRDYVIPDDIKKVVPDILRHRIVLSFDAIGSGTDTNSIINNLLSNVNVPK